MHLIKDNKHFSVGAIITRKKNNKTEYLLIDRKKPPLGWACVAGHIDEGDDSIKTLKKEVKEESGFDVTFYDPVILGEFIPWNKCRENFPHEWDVYKVEVEGELKVEKKEAKDFGWFTVEKIKELDLELVWKYFFEKLKIL